MFFLFPAAPELNAQSKVVPKRFSKTDLLTKKLFDSLSKYARKKELWKDTSIIIETSDTSVATIALQHLSPNNKAAVFVQLPSDSFFHYYTLNNNSWKLRGKYRSISSDAYTLIDLHVGGKFKFQKQEIAFNIFCI